MQIQELDSEHHLETNVTYFVLPKEDFGTFVHCTTITNTHSKQSMMISLLDGLAHIEPTGGKLNDFLKQMGPWRVGWACTFPILRNTCHFIDYQPSPTTPLQSKSKREDTIVWEFWKDMVEKRIDCCPLSMIHQRFGEDTTMLRPIIQNMEGQRHCHALQQVRDSTGWIHYFSFIQWILPTRYQQDELMLGPGETAMVSSFYGATNHIFDVTVYARYVTQE
jgi:hypothetical protein